MLISDLQLCLAHYCDVHGPTPMMVTEGLPVACGSGCDGHEQAGVGDRSSAGVQGALSSAHATAALTEAFRRISFGASSQGPSLAAAEHPSPMATASAADNETPPASPRRLLGQQQSSVSTPTMPLRRDSSFRRTYDDYVTKRAHACDNCAMTLPRRQESSAEGMRASADARNPTLRTRVPHARVYGATPGGGSPPPSQTASSSDTDGDEKPRVYGHRRTGTITSITSRSSVSSTSRHNSHTHYLDYTSTHEPVLPSSFSIVRASCLRTLSFEMLPRKPAGGGPGSSAGTPLVSPQTPSFVTTHSSGAAASGGPIFFGDPAAGYTTAYIFRIPDMHARGHKRVYAFLALSTHRERLAMKTFGFMSNAFHELAAWIQQLAEAEAEGTLSDTSAASSPVVANPSYGASAFSAPQPLTQPDAAGGSSFLAAAGGGLSRRMGGSFGGSGTSLRARGLPEIVGLPDFFIELHSRFVRLLLELGVVLNS